MMFAANSAVAQNCGKPAAIDAYPGCAGHMMHSMNLGEINKLKGTVFYENGEKAENAILELYRVSRKERKVDPYYFIKGKEPVRRLIVSAESEFCFKSLSDGVYVLKVGIVGSTGTECQHILLKIFKNKKQKSKPLEIFVPVAI